MPRVLMSFHFDRGWRIQFFECDRLRTALPRRAAFQGDEAMIEFIHRAGGLKTLEDRNILEMMMLRNFGETTLHLTDAQYAKLKR